MKSLIIALFVACLAVAARGDLDDLCDLSNPVCDPDECCVQDPRGRPGEGLCRDYGDDINDLCGGPNYCSCRYGFECVPHAPGSTLERYSNGSCQLTAERRAFLTARNALRRRPYYDDDDSGEDRRRRRR